MTYINYNVGFLWRQRVLVFLCTNEYLIRCEIYNISMSQYYKCILEWNITASPAICLDILTGNMIPYPRLWTKKMIGIINTSDNPVFIVILNVFRNKLIYVFFEIPLAILNLAFIFYSIFRIFGSHIKVIYSVYE